MTQPRLPQTPRTPPVVQHLRPPRPVRFPVEEQVPEGKIHLVVRMFLFRLLRFALGDAHSVGSDQFVYWNAASHRRCLAPDVFVKLGIPERLFDTWKTWEQGGAPELAVEIVSPNDSLGLEWEEKLARYHELGTKELVRFDPAAPEGARLRAWDRLEGDLVERVVERDVTPCLTLGLSFVVRPVEDAPVGLRLADEDGRLLESREEAEARARADEARARADEARARADEARAREAAEARVRELEAELRRRGG